MTQLARLHSRLLGATLVAVAIFMLLPGNWQPNSRALVGWDAGVVTYLALAGFMASRSSIGQMQERAKLEDEGATIILILILVAAIASLGAIAIELHGIHDDPAGQPFRVTIGVVTIFCSWFFVHTIFAIHYTHEYYGDQGERGGLTFPHRLKPDYWDFMYFSFNFGAAAQTSDVVIVSKRMRRLALGHAILSFLFNTTILALAVNVGASLI
ncbi:DUF1345 domain-containing protein [Microvirga sp. 2TAF3]|uniref:DUF1345 domain-containing protein n=1 Tax=Microvirga sp. 2TAF3 TaxID=3233014 RepID=UPI003F9B245B